MTGPAGEQGTPGAKGEPGHDGARGAAGSTGMRGPRGIDADEDATTTSGPLAMDFIRKLTLSVLALLTVVVAFLVFYLVTYVQDQRLLSECYRKAFEEQSAALAITVSAAGRDRRGLRDLLDSITNPDLPRVQRVADLEEYKRLLATGEAERATNPVLPTRTC